MRQPPRPRAPRPHADPSTGTGARAGGDRGVPSSTPGARPVGDVAPDEVAAGGATAHARSARGSSSGASPDATRADRGADRTGRTTRATRGPGTTRDVARRRTPRSLERPLEAQDAASLLGSHEDSVSTGLGERLAERRRARLRLRGTHLAVLLGSLATVAALVWGIFFSPAFALTSARVTVTGADGDVRTEVLHAVGPFLGTPVPRLDTAAVESAVEGVTMVRDARVSRTWPDGLAVTVQERVAALVEKDGSGVALVDDEGVVLSHEGEAPAGLPVVVLPADGAERARAAAAAASTWAALSADLRGSVTQVSADGNLVTLTLSGGRTVRWGTDEDGELKAEVLAVLLAQRAATVYDVSDPTRPVTS